MTIYPSLSALESFSLIQEVSANNLANINTNEFKAAGLTWKQALRIRV